MKQKQTNELKRIEELLNTAYEAERRNTEEALSLAKEALFLSEKHQLKRCIAQSTMRIGRCYWIKGEFDSAINHLNQALELATKIEHHETRSEALIGLGNVYITMELIDQAMNNYHTALRLVEEKQLDAQEMKLLNNLGTLHEDLKNYDSALKYYQRGYHKAEANQDAYGKAIANLNIGNVYLQLNELELAYQNIETAIQHAVQHHQTLLLAHSYYALGQYYQKLNKPNKSIEKLKLGIKNAEESKDFYILVRIYIEIANAFDAIKDVSAAKFHFEKAFALAKQMKSVEFMPRLHEQLALFYERNLFKEEAFNHYKAYFDSSKLVQENRRKERIKNIEFQTKLKDAIQETETYRVLSSELRKNFQQMQVLSDIGRSMTTTHDLDDIFSSLYDNINKLMVVDTLVLGFYNEEKNTLDFDLYIEDNQRQETFSLSLDNQTSLSVYSFLNQEVVKMDDVRKEYKKYIKGVQASRGTLMDSAMYAPLIVEGETIGIVSVQSAYKSTYTETHKVLFETLASYLAIATKNARYTKELDILNKKLKALSELDGLTSIPNRRLFDEMFASFWEQTQSEKAYFSVLFIDVDDFKDFNDNYSHLTGDEVIINVAQYLQNYKKDDYFVARYGGDEFVMLLPNVALAEAHAYALELKDSIMKMKHLEGVDNSVTVSIGLSTVKPDQTIEPDTFLKFVDDQLYESKKHGKNKVTSKAYEPLKK